MSLLPSNALCLLQRLPLLLILLGGWTDLNSQTTATGQSGYTLSGQVLNAMTDVPVYRALVQIDQRSQLSDHEGRFSFVGLSSNAATVRIYKPGYYATPEGEQTLSTVVTGGGSLSARLYPEAILTGTVTTADGKPAAEVMVTPRRSLYSDSGRQWTPMPPRQTNLRGEFRFAVPSGDYRLEIGSGRRQGFAAQIIVPEVYPTSSAADGSDAIHAGPGAEERLELQVETGPAFQIPIRTEPAGVDGFASITAVTSSGARLSANMTPGPAGSAPTIDLPRGSFTLVSTREPDGQIEYAETRVEVTGPTATPAVLRYVPVAPIPVVIQIDSTTSTSDKTPPTFQQLGLSLISTAANGLLSGRGFSRAQGPREASNSLRAMPGSYRLSSQARGVWHIVAATYGSVDLLQRELVVAPGAGSSPLVITVSSQTGSLAGAVTLSGLPQSVWVYLVPQFPSAVPYYALRSSPTGAMSLDLPPGRYQAIAFELSRQIDLRSPAVLAPYAGYVQSVTISAGERVSLDLQAVPASEIKP